MTIYFLWSAIFRSRVEIFGYEQREILTYILLGQFLAATVFSTRTHEIGGEINDGILSNFLLKPLSYFRYWWARDISDKILNIGFSVVEISVLVFLLRPSLIFQNNPQIIFYFTLSVIISALLYFYISFLISLSGFWTPDVWAPRFLFFVVTDFLSGGLFPLDILPKNIFFVFFLIFLLLLVGKTRVLGGYTIWQVVFFFLTFNFLDTLTQLLYRYTEMYIAFVTLLYQAILILV